MATSNTVFFVRNGLNVNNSVIANNSALTVNTTLSVVNSATFSNTTVFSGSNTVVSGPFYSNTLNVTYSAAVGGSITIGGGLTSGGVTINGAATVVGIASFGGNTTINGIATIGSGLVITSGGATITGGINITSGGGIITGGVTISGVFTVNNDIYATRSGGNTGAIFLGNTGSRYLFYDGTTYQFPTAPMAVGGTITASNFIVSSDIALKTNVFEASMMGSIIDAIKPKYFERTDIEDKEQQLGFVAQDFVNKIPEVLAKDTNDNLAIKHMPIIAALWQALRETREELKELKKKVG